MEPNEQRAPLQARIVRDLRNQIEAGDLRDGQALPSTRALAERFGVSVFTVNEAMRTLSEAGLVESQSRSRRIVRAPVPEREQRGQIPPRMLLIGGYAGSGKTEFGRILSRKTGWALLDKDTVTRPLVERSLEALGRPAHDRDSTTYLSEVRPREYEALMDVAYENAACGTPAIVTAPFLAEFADAAWIEREEAKFTDAGVPAVVVWVSCDAETMHTYIRRRGAARDGAKLADWANYVGAIDLELRPAADHLLIDNSLGADPLTTQAQRLIETLLGRRSSVQEA